MTDLQNDESGSQKLAATGKEIAGIHEDEINLADYLLILWKRKYLILLGSLVPILVVGLTLRFLPKTYKIAYVYDQTEDVSGRDFTQHSYKTLVDLFYSAENTKRIRAKLPEYDPQMVIFKTWPPFPSFSEPETKNLVQLEELGQMNAQLLYLSVFGKDRNDILKSASLIRDNFEYVLPLYSVMAETTNAACGYRTEMSKIEKVKFSQELQLETNRATLAKLKNIEPPSPDMTVDYPGWQIDVGAKTEYLPLEYQIQAVQLQIVRLEEKIAADAQRHDYYKGLVSINEKLSKELKDNTSANHGYTIHRFHSFLVDLLRECDDKPLQGYLNSYIKTIENRISVSVPVTSKPEILPMSKGIPKKILIVFLTALILSVSGVFLAEVIQQEKALSS